MTTLDAVRHKTLWSAAVITAVFVLGPLSTHAAEARADGNAASMAACSGTRVSRWLSFGPGAAREPDTRQVVPLQPAPPRTGLSAVELRRLAARESTGWALAPVAGPRLAREAQSGARQRSAEQKAAGAVIGALGGFLVGGFLGARLQGSCRCDDPGGKGFIVGAPIGAVVGGILGSKFFF
jgi:hypothetical protein